MKKLNEWEFENEEFRPDQDRNEEPKKVFTLNMTFENESDWLDMQEIIEQWDMGWLKGVYRSQAETTNDVQRAFKTVLLNQRVGDLTRMGLTHTQLESPTKDTTDHTNKRRTKWK